jgi:hypothetical protein
MRGQSNRRGNYLVLMGLGLPVLYGFVAISIDMARYHSAQTELKMASDASAHFALLSLRNGSNPQQMRGELRDFYPHNSVDNRAVAASDMALVAGHWDFDDQTFIPSTWDQVGQAPINAVKATGSRMGPTEGIPMTLTPFMGVDYLNAMRSSVAVIQPRDLIVVLDVTLSFRNDFYMAEKAALELLDSLRDSPLYGDRIAMVTFTGGAKVFTPLLSPHTDYLELRSKWTGDYWGAPALGDQTDCQKTGSDSGRWFCTGPQFVHRNLRQRARTAADPVPFETTDYHYARGLNLCNTRVQEQDPHGYIFGVDNVNTRDSALAPDMAACGLGGGGTNQGAGLDTALDELILTARSQSLWDILLISDGQPTVEGGAEHHAFPPYPMPNTGLNASTSGVRQFSRDVAAEACDKGVRVQTVSYGTNGGQTEFMRALACDDSSATSTHNVDVLFDLIVSGASPNVVLVE